MSDVSDLGLDLESLFQPAWAQGKTQANRFDKFTGNEGVKPERRFNDRPGERRGPRREGGFGGSTGRDRSGPPRGGSKFGARKKSFGQRDDNRGDRFNDSTNQRFEKPAPLPEMAVTFLPDEKGVEQLARQIKMTGRAYPLFQIAQLVLQKPERYSIQLAVKKKDDKILQPLFVCALDDTPWLSEEEVVTHVLKNHFAIFYQAERTATEPPKGTYTFVAQCGMSGAILGPPNYHDYQNQLRKLHTEKFSRMPFDVFKARVKIVKDEAVVKKWIEEQSFKTEYVALNVAEPLKLPSLEEVEKHFRATHKDAIIKPVESVVVDGVKSRNLRSRELQWLVRSEWENHKRFPLPLAMLLSRQFASHGLQFFKVNKTIVHVSVARPQFLDLAATPVSENIRRIIEFINAHPKCSRRKLIESLAPTPPKPTMLEVKPGEPEIDAPVEPTPEQTALIADLHWLIHQGHILEFADGHLDTAKKPLPRPTKPEKKKDEPKAGEEISTEEKSAETIAVEASPAENLPAETSSAETAATDVAPEIIPTDEVSPQP